MDRGRTGSPCSTELLSERPHDVETGVLLPVRTILPSTEPVRSDTTNNTPSGRDLSRNGENPRGRRGSNESSVSSGSAINSGASSGPDTGSCRCSPSGRSSVHSYDRHTRYGPGDVSRPRFLRHSCPYHPTARHTCFDALHCK